MVRNMVLPVLLWATAACGAPVAGKQETAAEAAPAKAISAKAGAPILPAAGIGKPVVFKEGADEDSWTFGYSWPAQANAIAPLDALLRARKDKVRAEWRADWSTAKSDCPPDSGSCVSRYYEEHWAVVADLADWLSLSSTVETYSGGAHGNHGFDALLWDKRSGKMREPTELFQSKRAFEDALRADLCKALDRERAERRENEKLEGFDECIDPTEAVIILGSSNGKAFDRVGFLIAPYIAGPYVEGDYEVTLPVTAKVLAKVRQQYRDSFVVAR